MRTPRLWPNRIWLNRIWPSRVWPSRRKTSLALRARRRSVHMRLLRLALAAFLPIVSATGQNQGVQTVGNGCGGNAGAGASLDLVGTLGLGSTSNLVARGM